MPTEANDLLLAETDFCLNLLKETPKEESLVFSPLSISLALSLVHAGAKGDTRQQITQAICKGANDDEVLSHYAALSRSFQNASEGVEINLANKMYIRQGFHIAESYLALIKKHFDATAENLDFTNGEASAESVNKFVSDATHGKIEKIVEADEFEDAAAFLINALYMKAEWQHKFYSNSTVEGDFHFKDGESRKVNFMRHNEVHREYAENEEVQVLSLKYKDESYAFNIFLPKDKNGLAAFREKLTASKMQELLGHLSSTYVSIKLPKLKIESSLKLKEILKKLGVTDVFFDNADLSGISHNSIKVSEVEHKAVIEMDEEGTVAAAVTSVRLKFLCGRWPREEPIPFEADHPFIYVITKDRHTVFIGQHY